MLLQTIARVIFSFSYHLIESFHILSELFIYHQTLRTLSHIIKSRNQWIPSTISNKAPMKGGELGRYILTAAG